MNFQRENSSSMISEIGNKMLKPPLYHLWTRYLIMADLSIIIRDLINSLDE